MAMLAQGPYTRKDFNISGLKGISDTTIQVHLGLYAGYVANTNTLNERIRDLTQQGKIGSPDWAELTRRLGFEYDGMILHEYYFSQLKPGGTPMPTSGALVDHLNKSFGSVDAWQSDFKGVGGMRGVGWAILFQDPSTGWLSNHWITLHQDGVPAGYKPILILDVWEHAFLLDYKPAERPKYIQAFLDNVDWGVVEGRLLK
ncbi:MAG: superoxide dismutase [Chloroflexi bacterium]|nr:superoxide dismutase [Chloroflexota bacterium]MCL5107463.1 superoxide dismutase [Chloroflexota bacterium]